MERHIHVLLVSASLWLGAGMPATAAGAVKPSGLLLFADGKSAASPYSPTEEVELK